MTFSLLWKELILFGLTQFLGIFSAYSISRETPIETIRSGFSFSITDVIILIVFAAIFFLLITRQSKIGTKAIRVFLSLAVFGGSQIIFISFIPEIPAILIAATIAFLFAFYRRVYMQNTAMVLGIAGVGSILGLSVTPYLALIILAALSVYDIIAVYWTKHMVKMAEGMIRSNNIFGFVIPENVKNLNSEIKQAKPGEGFMILGSGDAAVPLILSASIAPISVWGALIIAILGFIGLFTTHILFIKQKIRRPMAALPPIALASIVGYALIVAFNLI